MAHMVKCAVCGKTFDRDKVFTVKYSARRYAHFDCYPKGDAIAPPPQKDLEMEKLKEYINKLYGSSANWALITQQIKKFQTENNYSLSGILKSLVYFYEVKKNPIEKSQGGIGIVPYCYQDAYNYYYEIFLAQQNNNNKSIESTQVKEITIKPPKMKRIMRLKLFNLGDDDEE